MEEKKTTHVDIPLDGNSQAARLEATAGASGAEPAGGQAPAGRLSVALLQAENERLRAQLDGLLNEARANQDKMRRFDVLERSVIGAPSLAVLIKTLLVGYKTLFELDAVTLALVDPQYEVVQILSNQNAAGVPEERLAFLDNEQPLKMLYERGTKPILTKIGNAPDFLFQGVEPDLVSVALLPLVHRGKFIGSMNLGSKDPQRFALQSGTDFLERLASLVAVCLDSALTTERLKVAGMTDVLTGVHNRGYFDSRCQEEVVAARRSGAPLVCMFLDVDRFKNLNDTLGHQAGDAVLRYVAKLIKLQLRGSDLLARYGGEEFVVLLPSTTRHYGLETAERIRRMIENQSVPIRGNEAARVTISIGVAMLRPQPQPQSQQGADPAVLAAELVARADKAMYQAKEAGRNRVVFAPDA
jgi:two-component system cell cycle response regulator